MWTLGIEPRLLGLTVSASMHSTIPPARRFILKSSLGYFILYCEYLAACVSVYHMHAWYLLRPEERSDPPELDLQIVISYCMCAGAIRILCKSTSKCSSLLSHLTGPHIPPPISWCWEWDSGASGMLVTSVTGWTSLAPFVSQCWQRRF